MRLSAWKFTAEANNALLILFVCWKYESIGSWGFDTEEWQQLILWKIPRKAQILLWIALKCCHPAKITKDLFWNITYRLWHICDFSRVSFVTSLTLPGNEKKKKIKICDPRSSHRLKFLLVPQWKHKLSVVYLWLFFFLPLAQNSFK